MRGASSVTIFTGMCDASGAVEVSERVFAVADDEDNVIRTYDADRGGRSLAKFDLSSSLGLPMKGGDGTGKSKRAPETDLEAATRIGDHAYWITSHGRNTKGKLKRERLRFFATTLPQDGVPLELVGAAYEGLLDDLLAEPRLARFRLNDAASLAPKAPGGFNLEGMTARHEGGVWLGFRNPVPERKALLVPLLNPDAIVRAAQRAKFGDPVTFDLGGLGIRSLSSWRNRYLIAAGHYADGAPAKLFAWNGKSEPALVPGLDFGGFNPEAFFTPDARERILLLSDDGTLPMDGVSCSDLRDESDKRFRGAWVSLAKDE
jgi:hypothetical protein